MNRDLGETFHRIRLEHGFSVSDFQSINISKSSISKFENGYSSLKLDSVISALELMGTTLEEFDQYLNKYAMDDAHSLLKNIELAHLRQDIPLLVELHQSAKALHLHYVAIAAKASYLPLSEDETEEVVNYLYDITIWGYKELCILDRTLHVLSVRDLIHILKPFLENKNGREHALFKNSVHRTKLVFLCCHASMLLTYSNYRFSSFYIIDSLTDRRSINKMQLRNFINLARGYWIYKFSNTRKGKGLINDSLNNMEELGAPEVASYYKKLYKKYVEQET